MSAGEGAEAVIRLTVFLGLLAALMYAEVLWPFRAAVPRARRWLANAGLSLINTVALRVLLMFTPGLTIVAALHGEGMGSGLFPAFGLGGWVAFLLGFLVLDLAVYAQHVAFHRLPMFWRFHRVHHSDTEFDVTTAIRFHPGEILLSHAWKIIIVLAFGVPASAAFVFEVVLNAMSMFSHSNIVLPAPVERLVRPLLVTPAMHRVHHSVVAEEANSNFGFNLSAWDRLFGTYRAGTRLEPATMPIGLPSYREPETAGLAWLLLFPFQRGRPA